MRWFGPGSYGRMPRPCFVLAGMPNYSGPVCGSGGSPDPKRWHDSDRDRTELISHTPTLVLSVLSGATLDIGERLFINYGCALGRCS
jgi:hypothetical protein